jgi:hypothetical protein
MYVISMVKFRRKRGATDFVFEIPWYIVMFIFVLCHLVWMIKVLGNIPRGLIYPLTCLNTSVDVEDISLELIMIAVQPHVHVLRIQRRSVVIYNVHRRP